MEKLEYCTVIEFLELNGKPLMKNKCQLAGEFERGRTAVFDKESSE